MRIVDMDSTVLIREVGLETGEGEGSVFDAKTDSRGERRMDWMNGFERRIVRRPVSEQRRSFVSFKR